MTAQTAAEYEIAWRRLRWLRRSTFNLVLGGAVTIIVLRGLAGPGEGLLGGLLVVFGLGWSIAIVALFAARWRFLCPLCGKRFHSICPASNEAIHRCLKCGISIDEIPVVLDTGTGRQQ